MSETNRIGKCKQCDFALHLGDERIAVQVDGFGGVKPDGRPYRVGNEGFFSRCPNRHKFFPLKLIKGTYSPDHKCDSRCLNAKGHDCTCSCGGANHGRGYAVTVVEATVAPAAPVAAQEDITERQEAFLRVLLDERIIPDTHSAVIGQPPLSGDARREVALRMLDNGEFTKRQASKTIEWLLTLPKTEA